MANNQISQNLHHSTDLLLFFYFFGVSKRFDVFVRTMECSACFCVNVYSMIDADIREEEEEKNGISVISRTAPKSIPRKAVH